MWYSPTYTKTRIPVTMELFHRIKEFFRFAIPSVVMICLEWWSFELLIMLSGLLPNPQLETSFLSVCFNTIFNTLCNTIWTWCCSKIFERTRRRETKCSACSGVCWYGSRSFRVLWLLEPCSQSGTFSVMFIAMRRKWWIM